MSIGSISGSSYESMRSQMEAFRSGKTRIQKADLEEIKSAGASQNASAGKAAGGIAELIEKFSEIDTDGDGLSTEELQKAIEDGTITAPEGGPGGPPPGGPPPGGGKGPPPGGMKGPPPGGRGGGGKVDEEENGVAQSDLLAYDLFAEYKKQLESQNEALLAAAEEASASGTTSASQTQEVDLVSLLNQSADTESETESSADQAKNLMNLLTRQLFKAYNQQSSMNQLSASSILGDSVVA